MSAQPRPGEPTAPTAATAELSAPVQAAEQGAGEAREAPAVGSEDDSRPGDVDGTNGLTKSQLKRRRKKGKQVVKGSTAAAAGNAGVWDADSSTPAPPVPKMECAPVQQPLSSQFELELDWCCEQLQLGLRTRKASPKQAEEAVRALRVLSSSKAPPVRKRQVMQAVFGDYRKKMANDRAKNLRSMETALKTMKLVPMPAKPKSVFYKACVSSESRNEGHKRLRSTNEQSTVDGAAASAAVTAQERGRSIAGLPACQPAMLQPPPSDAPPASTTAHTVDFCCSAREFKFNFFDVSDS